MAKRTNVAKEVMKINVRKKVLKVQVSGKFMAILDCMLEVEPKRTGPALAELVVTSDLMLLGREEGDIGYNSFLGTVESLYGNLIGLAKVAGLTTEEQRWFTKPTSSGLIRVA